MRIELRHGLVVFADDGLFADSAPAESRAREDSSEESSRQHEPSRSGIPASNPTPREESSEESPRRQEASRTGAPSPKPTPREESSEESLRQEFSPEEVAEVFTVDRWIQRNAGRLELLFVDGEFASPLPRVIAGRSPGNRTNST
jgi:hypothetical protein